MKIQGDGCSHHVPRGWHRCLDVAGECHHCGAPAALSGLGQETGDTKSTEREMGTSNIKPIPSIWTVREWLEDIPTTIFFSTWIIVISSPCFMFHSLIFWRNLRNFNSSQEFRGGSTEATGADQTLGSTHAGDQGASPFFGRRGFLWGRSSVRLVELGICHGEIANSRVGICITKELGTIFWCGPENGV